MSKVHLHSVVVATLLIFAASPLRANIVNPGDTNVPPDAFTVSSTPPILGDLTGTWFIGGGSGTWEAVVLVDPLGITCSGCLDFAFQISVDPNVPFAASFVNPGSFFGYTTDAGYVIDSGDRAPIAVNRGSLGAGVGFVFTTLASTILPGQSSDFLVVATNATSYDTKGVLGINGTNGTQNFNGLITGVFEPTQVPEPAAALLLGLGLVGIAAFRKRCSNSR